MRDFTKVFDGGEVEHALHALTERHLRSSFFGPVAWCKRCSRRHRRRACNLVPAERIAKSGRKVIRLVHPTPRPAPKPKTQARKS